MRLKKGMRKALSLALSTALIITSANIGSTKSKAAEADDATHSYVATVEKNKLTKVTLDGKDVTDSQIRKMQKQYMDLGLIFLKLFLRQQVIQHQLSH